MRNATIRFILSSWAASNSPHAEPSPPATRASNAAVSGDSSGMRQTPGMDYAQSQAGETLFLSPRCVQLGEELFERLFVSNRVEVWVTFEHRRVFEPLGDRLSQVGDGFRGSAQMRMGLRAGVPGPVVVRPFLDDLPEIRDGLVPLREVVVDVTSVEPIHVHV